MRKLLLALTLSATLAIGLGITAPTASAANCTASASPFVDSWTFGGNVPAAQTTLSACTGVEAVRFYLGGNTAFWSTSGGPTYYATHYQSGTAPCNSSGLKPITAGTIFTCTGVASLYTNWVYRTSPWWTGCRSTTVYWVYQLKNSATHTWGSVYYSTAAATLCI